MPLLTLRLSADATLADALKTLRLTEDEVDMPFGLVPVDPAAGLFALRVSDTAAARLTTGVPLVQIYADPRISPTESDA
ncbi:hypothetical protein GFY24_24250 [Nocardia sp. SYP-A9097]|uniref:hypothetical protein n=1 Tax=Nocardia sp. SYP-A9097 TaxID=2663237 RepID=UPI00129A4C57|nr:hypothetical protein [Nocardia sp. SYP-A9097]MRH90518.1 hypothetical protein [Nocardia sp. SYP-A9097]